MVMENWDTIIIGAGAAGLAAALYCIRSGLKTLVLEEKAAGGTTADAPIVENYPGFRSVTGTELMQKMGEQTKAAGVTIREFEAVSVLDLKGEKKIVKTNKSAYEVLTVIIASGASYRQIGVPGEKEFRGKGVSYCGICDGPLFKGKRVAVVGGGNSALITALYLSDIVAELKVVHRRNAFRGEEALAKALTSKTNVEILLNSVINEIKGDKVVRSIIVQNTSTNETKEMTVDGVFVQVGEYPNSQFAKQAGITVDSDGFIVVDNLQHTNLSGVYAAGDVTNHPVKQIGTAVGQGITAALEAHGHIREPYYYKR
jgi:thioredoxin reductase (NADPH)